MEPLTLTGLPRVLASQGAGESPRGEERSAGHVAPAGAHVRWRPDLGIAIERELELHAARIVDEELPEAGPRDEELAPVERGRSEALAELVKAVGADRQMVDRRRPRRGLAVGAERGA